MSDKIRVSFLDITGSKHADVTLKSSLTADEVVEKLKQNDFLAELDTGQVYVLQNKRTGETIQPNQSFESAGIQDGDVLISGVMTRGGGIKSDIPDEVARKQLESLSDKIKAGDSVNKNDIENLKHQIDRMEQYLKPSIPLIIPEPQDLAVRLVKADLLSVMEDYRSDENKWYSISWAFIGAILGIIVNWLTAQPVIITIPSVVIIIAFGIIATFSWISAKNFGKRAERMKANMLIENGKESTQNAG